MKRCAVLATLVAAGALSITLAAFQQPPAGQPAPMVIEVDKLKDNLFVLKGGGGNTAVFVTATGVVVVDTKNPGWGQPILDQIKTLTDKPVTTIINTHTHGDHVSGNVAFPATVEVITQENTKKYMDQPNPVFGLQTTATSVIKDSGGKGLPTRTFKDKLSVGSGADQIDLRYYGPAHTGGDAFVIFKQHRVMHVGDTFPTRALPIMDRNNGGTGVGYSRTIAAASRENGVDTIINGHNATTTTPADLRLYSEFIADFVKFVQDAKKAGKTVDDVVSTWTTPAKYTGYAAPDPANELQVRNAAMRVRSDAQVIWDETK
jgi:glyoxylase-like metal-dependent hydrolase (beta-lactamase superfamily II)